MHPLSKQIQISCDGVKGFVCRLTGSEIPENADTEKSIDELITRIESVISIVNSYQESDYQKANEVNIVLPWMKHAMPGKFLTADVYLNQFAIPNIYFHLVTAYNIMRMAGVPIGKFDYIGGLELSE